MPVYVEIAGRAYPLRFTLRGALRLLDLTGQTPMELLAPGLRNTVLLLYAALCDGCPHVTLSQAAALCAAAARERDALSRLLSALALALAELVYTLIIFATGHPVAGWTTTMFVITVGFAGLFAVLTIVVKYLSLLLELTFKQQKYLVESIEKLQK